MSFELRKAVLEDAGAIAAVFCPSLRLLKFLPELHTIAEDHWFIENVILNECEVTVAVEQGKTVSFLARAGEEIRLLHTHPGYLGQGAGSLLIKSEQARSQFLKLWCFQQNLGARRFYERHGFVAERLTDGEHNEEKVPDVLYCWRRQ